LDHRPKPSGWWRRGVVTNRARPEDYETLILWPMADLTIY
jgi:hypothetical protein